MGGGRVLHARSPVHDCRITFTLRVNNGDIFADFPAMSLYQFFNKQFKYLVLYFDS